MAPISKWRKYSSLFTHARKEEAAKVLLVLLIILFMKAGPSFEGDSLEEIEHIISFTTLAVAVFVWFGSINTAWRSRLPKRLTVKFFHNGALIMMCKQAHLSVEADIRPLAQQIGSQMASPDEEKPLKLTFNAAMIEYGLGEISLDEKSKILVQEFTVAYKLRSVPPTFKEKGVPLPMIWRPPFDGDAWGSELPNSKL